MHLTARGGRHWTRCTPCHVKSLISKIAETWGTPHAPPLPQMPMIGMNLEGPAAGWPGSGTDG